MKPAIDLTASNEAPAHAGVFFCALLLHFPTRTQQVVQTNGR